MSLTDIHHSAHISNDKVHVFHFNHKNRKGLIKIYNVYLQLTLSGYILDIDRRMLGRIVEPINWFRCHSNIRYTVQLELLPLPVGDMFEDEKYSTLLPICNLKHSLLMGENINQNAVGLWGLFVKNIEYKHTKLKDLDKQNSRH